MGGDTEAADTEVCPGMRQEYADPGERQQDYKPAQSSACAASVGSVFLKNWQIVCENIRVNNWSLTYKMERYDKMENWTGGPKS